jgi:hypothetical protein
MCQTFWQIVSIPPFLSDVLVKIAKRHFPALLFSRQVVFYVQKKSHRAMLTVIAMRILLSIDVPAGLLSTDFLFCQASV